jgi:Chaperone for flagella basal body P-ring formation
MSRRFGLGLVLLGVGLTCGAGAFAQSAGCSGEGRRVVATRWDAVLGKGWELVEDCAHPERPARLVAAMSVLEGGSVGVLRGLPVAAIRPLLVRAGDVVRLWQQTATVRIEMNGVAEQSAANGEHVVVRTTRQTDDAGLAVQRIDGTVRGAGDVEMERQW